MSTMEVLGAGWHAMRAAARQKRAMRSGTRTATRHLGQVIAEHGLYVAAASCFVAAAVMVAVPLGLAVAGVGLLVLELRAGD